MRNSRRSIARKIADLEARMATTEQRIDEQAATIAVLGTGTVTTAASTAPAKPEPPAPAEFQPHSGMNEFGTPIAGRTEVHYDKWVKPARMVRHGPEMLVPAGPPVSFYEGHAGALPSANSYSRFYLRPFGDLSRDELEGSLVQNMLGKWPHQRRTTWQIVRYVPSMDPISGPMIDRDDWQYGRVRAQDGWDGRGGVDVYRLSEDLNRWDDPWTQAKKPERVSEINVDVLL